MAWPDSSDYSDAIQTPTIAFSDSELQKGAIRLDKLGLPRPISGNFAVVFEVHNGSKKWAVRCFSREIPEQKRRYDAISQYLRNKNLPYTVNFEFLQQGIRVKGNWYPIVKMEWVDGIRLDEYLERNLYQPTVLQRLVQKWVELVGSLRKEGIAHGDLQHGNIVVTQAGDLKLVDYDGMYVPNLNITNVEIGHRHYQHPSRRSDASVNTTNFLQVDNFSTWVIGISLALLYLDPKLWSTLQAGDDCLLFREKDFKSPSSSNTFQILNAHADAKVRQLGHKLIQLAQSPSFLQVLPLDDVSFDDSGKSQLVSQGVAWLKDYVQVNQKGSLTSKADEAIKLRGASWVLDFVTDEKPLEVYEFPDEFITKLKADLQKEFQGLSLTEKLKTGFRWQGYAPKRIKQRYPTFPFVVKQTQMKQRLSELEGKELTLARELNELKTKLTQAQNQLAQINQYESEIRAIDVKKQSITAEISNLNMREQQDLRAVEGNLRSQIDMHLRSFVLAPGMVTGIGKVRIQKLANVGVQTASDITQVNEARAIRALTGIYNCDPPTDWNMLLRWRGTLERMISAQQPRPEEIRRDIERKYAHQRAVLKQKEVVEEANEATLRQKRSNSTTPNIAPLQSEIYAMQQELDEIQIQQKKLQRLLGRYRNLTPDSLIDVIVRNS